MNIVILIGRLGKDPIAHIFKTGGRIVNLTLATSEKWKDKVTGEYKEKVEWHTIRINNDSLIDMIVSKYKKGDLVNVTGQLRHRKYTDKDGHERVCTEIEVAAYRGNISLVNYEKSDSSEQTSHESNVPSNFDMNDDLPF